MGDTYRVRDCFGQPMLENHGHPGGISRVNTCAPEWAVRIRIRFN